MNTANTVFSADRPGAALGHLRRRLRRTHRENGEPSTREIARRTGKTLSHTTVSVVLRCEYLPKWGPLELIVEAIGGDVEEFRQLWLAARDALDLHADAGTVRILREVIDLIRARDHESRIGPFRLASGQMGGVAIDGKYIIGQGIDLQLISTATLQMLNSLGISFTAVVGRAMGGDVLASGLAIAAGCKWSSVRLSSNGQVLNSRIDGARLNQDDRVVLVDDVVTTGAHLRVTMQHVTDAGVEVVAAVAVVDRGDTATRLFEKLGLPYCALVNYSQLQLPPTNTDLGSIGVGDA